MEANGPSASEGRLRSPAGAYTSVQSPEGVPVFGASEASEDGSKRPERKRGSFALTRRGMYQCSITRRGKTLKKIAAGAQRLLRTPKARAWRAERRRREGVRSPAVVKY